MTSAIHNPFLESLKKALHREASQVGFLAIEDVDRVFASAETALSTDAEPAKLPLAAMEKRDVDEIDVTGWGVIEGHAIPFAVARKLAARINLCIRSALSAQVQDAAVPEGWQLVPKEPTATMAFAGINAVLKGQKYDKPSDPIFAADLAACSGDKGAVRAMQNYRAMLAAAPAAKQGEAESETCPMCLKAFKLGDVLRARPNAPGPVHAACLDSKPDIDQETGKVIIETLPTFLFGEHPPVPDLSRLASPEPEICPICREPFKLSDVCATDITEGTCHAECIDGSAVFDLATGEETDSPLRLYHYIVDAAPAPFPQTFLPTHRHTKRGSSYQLIGAATVQTDSKLTDMDSVVIYRNEDGTLWARSCEEFFDGRFEAIDATTLISGASRYE